MLIGWRLTTLLLAVSFMHGVGEGLIRVGLEYKQEKWTAHTTEIQVPGSKRKHKIEGGIIDLGPNSRYFALYERARVHPNVHYAGKPHANFEPAKMVDSDEAFELMVELREKRERKGWERREEGLPKNAPIPYYMHYGAPCPQPISKEQADEYHEQNIATQKLEVIMPNGETVEKDVIMDDLDEDNPLHLNIFAPDSGIKHRVFIYVPGGGFFVGSAAKIDVHGIVTQFVSQDVLVVIINHRLGPFGFLSGEELNLGIGDIFTALKWVKRYISFFGGDPNHITFGGESAGASAVARIAFELFRKPALDEEENPIAHFHQLFLMSGTGSLMEKDSTVWGVRDIRADFFRQLCSLKGITYNESISEMDLMTLAKNAETKEILQAAIAAEINWWDMEFYRHPTASGTPATADPQWFDKVARKLIGEQTAYKGTRILFLVTRDESAVFHKMAWETLPQSANAPEGRILSKLSDGADYYIFRRYLQPIMAKYGYHWLTMQENFHQPLDIENFRPAEWFFEARKEYEKDMKWILDWFEVDFKLVKRNYPFEDFKRYYIDLQILSDLMFVLATAKDAIDLAKLNHVFLMRLSISKSWGDSLPFPNDVIPHGMGNRNLFMPLDFFVADASVNKQNANTAGLLSKELVAFINGGRYLDPTKPDDKFNNNKYALKHTQTGHAPMALPFREVLKAESEWHENGFMSSSRLDFWSKLFGANREREAPFEENGVLTSFDKQRREAVLEAIRITADRKAARGLMNEVTTYLPPGMHWELPTSIKSAPEEEEDVLKLVDHIAD